jgi:hypothetical protein
MRRSRVAVAAICVLLAGCSTSNAAESAPAPRKIIPRPLMDRELPVLLLTPEEAADTMAAPGMAVTETQTAMSDNSAIMAPPECLALDGAAEAVVYNGSGFTAERDMSLNDGNDFKHYLKQAVVRFPYHEMAAAFFDASAQQWPACHDYTHTQSGSQWTAAGITNADGTLSAGTTYQDAAAPGWGCGRALKLVNNIIVDVNTCSAAPADSAVRVANRIADKVNAQW